MYRVVWGFIILLTAILPAVAIEEIAIEYSVNTDYVRLLEKNSSIAYQKALQTKNENDISNAIGGYRTLFSLSPDNTEYCLKIAELYDLYDKRAFAKEFFSRTLILDPKMPSAHEGFGNHYYKQNNYRMALKEYNEAYRLNLRNYNISSRLGTIYQKFGDTQMALKHFKEAQDFQQGEELAMKIRLLEELNSNNTVYYQNKRIGFVED